MNKPLATVKEGLTKYTLYKDRTVVMEELGRAARTFTITSVSRTVQDLFEDHFRLEAAKSAEDMVKKIESTLGEEPLDPIPVEAPTYEQLQARVALLEGLLVEVKAPFAFSKDLSLYRRIYSALNQPDPQEIIATHNADHLMYFLRRNNVVEIKGVNEKGPVMSHLSDVTPSVKNALLAKAKA